MYRRLHPLTLVHEFAAQLPTLVLLAVSFTFGTGRSGQSIGTLAALGISALLFGPLVLARYLRFRYRVTESAVEVESGIFSRQHRVIPLDRIQTVEVEQPLLARLLGTARVLLLTGSGAGAEATLAYVRLEEAARLREEVRGEQGEREGEKGGQGEGGTDARGSLLPFPPSPLPLLFRLSTSRLVRAGLYRLSLGYLAVAYSALNLIGLGPEDLADWALDHDSLLGPFAAPAMLAGLAVVLALGLAWAAGFVTTVLRYAGFRLTDDGTRLHTQAGLLSRWERGLPRTRIQAFHSEANPLMAWGGYERLSAQSLGLDQRGGLEVLAPLAHAHEAEAIREAVRPLAPVAAWLPVSPRHALRLFMQGALLIVVLAASGAFWSRYALVGLGLLPVCYGLARLQARRHVWAVTADALHVRRGAFWRQRAALPRASVQTAGLRATFVQRSLGLASVVVDTAGGSSRGIVVRDLPAPEADALLVALRFEEGDGLHA